MGSDRRRSILALLLVAFPGLALGAAEVRARLGAASVPVDGTVTLVVEGFDVEGELDTEALETVFDVVVRSRASRIEIVDGDRGTVSTFVLELTPRSVGIFTVPPVRVGALGSGLLTLEVTDPPTGADRDVFAEATVDVTSPWVQAQAIVTLSAWFGVPVMDQALELPAVDDAAIVAIDEVRVDRRVRDGRPYDVVERRYAVFPQASGPLVLEPVLVAVVGDGPVQGRGRLSATRRVTRRGPPLELDVRPRPPGGGAWWLPATSVTLEARWPGSPEPRVGEPLTRAVTLRADGVRVEQLPTWPDVDVPGASVHVDAPESLGSATPAGLRAEHRVAQAIIPRRPGPLELPAVEVRWFDTAAGVARTATLPAETLEVAPSRRASPAAGALAGPSRAAPPGGSAADAAAAGGGASSSVDAVRADGGGRRWRLVALLAMVGWLATAAALVLGRRRSAISGGHEPESSASAGVLTDEARRGRRTALVAEMDAAVRSESSREVARSALALAALRWPRDPPRDLASLAERLSGRSADREVARALVDLDVRLYGRGAKATATPGPPPRFAERLDGALGGAADGPGATGEPSPLRAGSALPPL